MGNGSIGPVAGAAPAHKSMIEAASVNVAYPVVNGEALSYQLGKATDKHASATVSLQVPAGGYNDGVPALTISAKPSGNKLRIMISSPGQKALPAETSEIMILEIRVRAAAAKPGLSATESSQLTRTCDQLHTAFLHSTYRPGPYLNEAGAYEPNTLDIGNRFPTQTADTHQVEHAASKTACPPVTLLDH